VNALNLARAAYGTAAAPIQTDRGAEYQVFSQITQRLRHARRANDFVALSKALHDNRRLWSLLAADVADPENRLPEDLRARLFYLAEFTMQHTSKVLRKEARADILIDINTWGMRGLQGEVGAP